MPFPAVPDGLVPVRTGVHSPEQPVIKYGERNMTDTMLANHEYTMGYSPEFLKLLERRNAQTHAGYLLPSLSPGLRLLDFGCGPGTITLGLAALVRPGEVHGVDLEESKIEMARAAAEAGGHDNTAFHVGNVYRVALRRRLLRRGPLPRGADARPRHPEPPSGR